MDLLYNNLALIWCTVTGDHGVVIYKLFYHVIHESCVC